MENDADNDNEPEQFIALAALTANVIEHLKQKTKHQRAPQGQADEQDDEKHDQRVTRSGR